MPLDLPSLTLAETFALILEGLCRAVAAQSVRNPVATPVFVLLWGRLRRLSRRFASLAARVQSGTRPTTPRPARPRAPSEVPRPRLPGGFAWVLPAVPGAAGYACQLRHLLAQPEMAALLEAAPQAGRLLRPLCRMLGIDNPPGPPRPAPEAPAPRSPSPDDPAPSEDASRPQAAKVPCPWAGRLLVPAGP